MTQTSAASPAASRTNTAAEDRSEPVEWRTPQRSTGDKVVGGVSHTVLTIWCLIVVVPLLWVIMSSFKTSSEIFASPFSPPSSLQFINYANALTTAGIGSFFFNSVIVVFGALFVTMLFGSMSAYVLARFTFPGSRILYYLMLAGLTFPVFLAIVPLFFVLRGIGLLNTLPGLILTYAAFAFPFTVFFLFAFFRSLSKSIAEAAAIDGAGEWRTFFSVMLPMAKPGLATVAILNFVGLWNQFLLPVALNTNRDNYVLTQGMAAFASQAGYSVDFGALFAAVVITVIPVLIVYLIFQRQLQGSVSQGTNK
jgi:N-acetylglucosamine transport system permease protein